MTDFPTIQGLVDRAYDRWQTHPEWSKQEFWDQLDANERVAIFVGNMNYQVENGGFMQWHDNGYATDETVGFLLRLCDRVGTDAAANVKQLLERFSEVDFDPFTGSGYDEEEALADIQFELDKLDRLYYTFNEAWMADVEAFLK